MLLTHANKTNISVIVPVYNAEVYLISCIESLLNQTHKNIEIILINDGSIDKSEEICKLYSSKYKNIKYFHQENRGVSAARNKGIEEASGKYVMFVDSDDKCDKKMVEEMYKNIIEHNDDIAVAGVIIDDMVAKKKIKRVPNKSYIEMHKNIMYLEEEDFFESPCNKIYKLDIIKKNNIKFNENISNMEDLLFNCEYMMNASSIKIINNAFYHYVKRDIKSLSTSYNRGRFDNRNIIYQSRQQMYIKINTEEYDDILNYTHIKYIRNCIFSIYNKNNQVSYKDRINIISEIKEDKAFCKLINKFEGKNIHDTIFKNIMKIDNYKIVDLNFKFLFYCRYKFSIIYSKIFRK